MSMVQLRFVLRCVTDAPTPLDEAAELAVLSCMQSRDAGTPEVHGLDFKNPLPNCSPTAATHEHASCSTRVAWRAFQKRPSQHQQQNRKGSLLARIGPGAQSPCLRRRGRHTFVSAAYGSACQANQRSRVRLVIARARNGHTRGHSPMARRN